MNTISKILWAVLAGIVMLWIGGGTPIEAATSYDQEWTEAMNQTSYWSPWQCTKYDGHDGQIGARYDAVIVKAGTKVRVYPDVSNVGAFQASAPDGKDISWVMKCTFPPDDTTTTTTTTTVEETTTTTTEPDETTTTTTDEPNETTTTQPDGETTTTTVPPCKWDPNLEADDPGCIQCPPIDGVRQFPQNYEPDAPCGPIDPCVDVDPVTGEGTSLWHVNPCKVPPHHCYPVSPCVPDIVYEAPDGSAKTLPSTGTELDIAIVALMSLVFGGTALWAARR